MKSTTIYPGKVLLLGEYTVLAGGVALAVPSEAYYARWMLCPQIDDRLLAFCDFLEQNDFTELDIWHMRSDVGQGWQVCSNIPQGYGCGSSGTVVAAVYDTYLVRRPSIDVQSYLARMENFFHGQSSGIDPMVSLAKTALYKAQSTFYTLPSITLPSYTLVDSGRARVTGPLVQEFRRLMLQEKFAIQVERLKACNEEAALAMQEGDMEALKSVMRNISILQLEYFEFAILPSVRDRWIAGLDSGKYMKLCGAGGGGFYMEFNFEEERLIK